MLGAIIGDIVGSKFEFQPIKSKNFLLFSEESDYTDDSLMTIAVGLALKQAFADNKENDAFFLQNQFIRTMQSIGRSYPNPTGAYGSSFSQWLVTKNPEPYNSWGNGSAMRVSACGELAESLEEALFFAEQSAIVSHNHPEGIKGAQAIAAAIFLAKRGKSKEEIRHYIYQYFYPERLTVEEIRPRYSFDPSCQGTVPQAFAAFFDSVDFEDAIRNAISLGGDADTLGAITGSLAWPFYIKQNGLSKAMKEMASHALHILPSEFRTFLMEYEDDFIQTLCSCGCSE